MNFLPVKGYEGLYEVSDTGIVRSIPRIVIGKDGVKYPFKGKILAIHPNKLVKYFQVNLWKNNIGSWKYVHRLVAEAFIPNPNNLPEVNHIDGNRQNNNVSNLEWVTSQGNKLHAIRTGLKVYKNRLTKDEFVQCLFDVIAGESYLSLSQRVPYKVPFLSTKIRAIAKELNLEHELDESLKEQKRIRSQKNGAKHKRTNY